MKNLGYLNPVLAVLLLLCLAPMPYGYYLLVRFVAMMAFAVMAYIYNAMKNNSLAILFVALTLLFQPYIKIALGRTLWNIVDVIVAVGLIAIWMKERKTEEQ